MDLIRPVIGIRLSFRYILTTVDSFSRLLAMWPVWNKKVATVAAGIHSILSTKMGYGNQIIVNSGSELLAVDTRALLEDLGVKMELIPGSKHQHNLVERVHRILLSRLRAIWEMANIETWHAAVNQATYQYNTTTHSTTVLHLLN